MAVKIVDASALAALVFGEPEAEAIVAQLSSFKLAAPQLLWFELASVARKKAARQPDSAERIRGAFSMAGRLDIDILSVDHLEVIDLAEKVHLTTYDASYLWLAMKTGGTLVTLDKRLREAWTGQSSGR